MLVLSRKRGQVIVVGDDVRITVVEVDRGKVRLGIEAPPGVAVDREEIRVLKDAAAKKPVG